MQRPRSPDTFEYRGFLRPRLVPTGGASATTPVLRSPPRPTSACAAAAGASASGGTISAGRRRTTDRNASTTAGLNCFPRPAWIWSIASSTSSATAYGRSVVMASHASAIAMIAASSGTSLPLRRSGYPRPSQRSWWWRMAGTESFNEEIRATISAPRSTCSRMIAASARSSVPGFVRIESGIPIFPMSWKRAAVASDPSCLAGRRSSRPIARRRGVRAASGRPCTGRVPRPPRSGLDRLEERRLELARGLEEVVRPLARASFCARNLSGRAAGQSGERQPQYREDEEDRDPDRPLASPRRCRPRGSRLSASSATPTGAPGRCAAAPRRGRTSVRDPEGSTTSALGAPPRSTFFRSALARCRPTFGALDVEKRRTPPASRGRRADVGPEAHRATEERAVPGASRRSCLRGRCSARAPRRRTPLRRGRCPRARLRAAWPTRSRRGRPRRRRG